GVQTCALPISGKWFNGGQTCIAPDYVLLVGRQRRDAFVQALREQVMSRYGDLRDGAQDYTRIIDPRHFARLQGYVDEARARGCEGVEIGRASCRGRG